MKRVGAMNLSHEEISKFALIKAKQIRIAEFLYSVGWGSPNDAQWDGLQKFIEAVIDPLELRIKVLETALEAEMDEVELKKLALNGATESYEQRIADLEEDLRKQFEIHAEMARVLGERIDMLEKANAMFAYEWKKDHSHGEFQKEEVI